MMTEDEKKKRIADNKRRYYERNRELVIERAKLWQKENAPARKEYWENYYKENKERRIKNSREDYKKNRKARLEQRRQYREQNKEIVAKGKRRFREENREKIASYKKIWARKNKPRVNGNSARRRSYKLNAVPKWMTKADFVAIQEWYQLAKDLQWLSEEKLHVDHIIPLQGENVCGLHIAANLQILPASENIRKGNRLGHK